MGLHGLASVTIGVLNIASTAAYCAEFGLTPQDDGWLSTTDGGKQLRLIRSPRQQLVEMVPAQHHDDIDRIGAGLAPSISRSAPTPMVPSWSPSSRWSAPVVPCPSTRSA